MVSFKLKLVCCFVLLTLVPLGAAFWGFDALARRSEARRVKATRLFVHGRGVVLLGDCWPCGIVGGVVPGGYRPSAGVRPG